MKNTFGKTLGCSLSISMCMQNFIEIFQRFKRYGQVHCYQNSGLGKASTDEKWHLTIFWTGSCQYQCLFEISPKIGSRTYWYRWKYDALRPNLSNTRKYDVFSQKWCYIRKCDMSEPMLHAKIYNAQTYVTREYEMCSIRTNVTSENVICPSVCYTRKYDVLCPNECYLRKLVLSTHEYEICFVRINVTYENV